MAANPMQADLTSPRYWDGQWDRARAARAGMKLWLRRQLRMGPGKLFDFLTAQLDKCGNRPLDVLEIGCAPGSVLAQLASLRPKHRYHGVDFSEQGLADASRRFAAAGMSVALHHADIREFDPGERYDVVFSCGLIEHFTEPLPILAHHGRLCAPDGRVIVTVPNHTGRLQEFVISQIDPEGLASHNLRIMSETSLERLMESAGLTQVSTGRFGRRVIRPIRRVETLRARILQRGVLAFNEASRFVPPPLRRPHVFWASGTVSPESCA